jgi:hypothetical protein
MAVERATDGCWSVEQLTPGGALISKFIGPTPTAEFSEFLAALTPRMPEAHATLVFDLRELDGYNPETKEPVKAWLATHKLAIREVIVVVPKSEIMLKVVTAAIGLAVGVKITIREEPRDADLWTKVVGL